MGSIQICTVAHNISPSMPSLLSLISLNAGSQHLDQNSRLFQEQPCSNYLYQLPPSWSPHLLTLICFKSSLNSVLQTLLSAVVQNSGKFSPVGLSFKWWQETLPISLTGSNAWLIKANFSVFVGGSVTCLLALVSDPTYSTIPDSCSCALLRVA